MPAVTRTAARDWAVAITNAAATTTAATTTTAAVKGQLTARFAAATVFVC